MLQSETSKLSIRELGANAVLAPEAMAQAPERVLPRSTGNKQAITGLTHTKLCEHFRSLGKERYRAQQVFYWLYRKKVESFSEMTNLSKEVRQYLEDNFYIPRPPKKSEQISREDGSRKYLFELEDNRTIETVVMPIKDRITQCVSSQVGCAMSCSFCNTGDMGLMRNLKTHEIIDQVMESNRQLGSGFQEEFGERITNLVFMGMGEPLHNLDAVVDAISILTDPHGFNISHRKITVSTSGLVPQMLELGARSKANLAVSLNATTDELRDQIMPVNKRYNLSALLEGCRKYPLGPTRRITFEYVLLKGLNDTIKDAERILKLLRGIPAKVNLIPFNPHPASPYERPALPTVLAFQKYLLDRDMTTTVRFSKGPDILAACGQLRSKEALKSKYQERRAREEQAKSPNP